MRKGGNHILENKDHSKKKKIHDDHFTRMMFGAKKRAEVEVKEELTLEKTIERTIEKHLEGIDLDEIMKTVDLFMTSTKQLKPLIDKITPHISNLIKKK
jgi:hypothetical protein